MELLTTLNRLFTFGGTTWNDQFAFSIVIGQPRQPDYGIRRGTLSCWGRMGFAPFAELSADPKQVDFQEAYFLGASRARQLLGVVSVNA